MKSFCVVHLSDLHIGLSKGDPTNGVLDALLDDLQNLIETHNLKIDSVVMTGDTVDRGGTKESYSRALNFYNRLLETAALAKEQLVVIPGNHDVPRQPFLSSVFNEAVPSQFNDPDQFHQMWQLFSTRYRDFNSFSTTVSGRVASTDEMYGASISDIAVDSGLLRFIHINSSWATFGTNDYGNLRVTKCQLNALIEKLHTLPKSDLALALIHHPLDWLNPDDRENLEDTLMKEYGIPVTAILHGHIHRSKVDSLSTPDSELLRLVSGIGYPDTRDPGQPKLSNCRYCVYEFDIDANKLTIYLRTTTPSGHFVADTSLYRAAGETGIISMPLARKFGSVGHENTGEDRLFHEVDPVPYAPDWVGRDVELSKLATSGLRVVAVTGMGGQGKSTLVAEFLRRNAKGEERTFDKYVWLDCRELAGSLHAKVIEALDGLTNGRESSMRYRDEPLDQTMTRLLKQMRQHRCLIVFDNVDAYISPESEDAVGELKPIVEMSLNNEHSSLILLTSRTAFWDQRVLFRHIPLDGFSTVEGLDFLRRRGINLTGDNSEPYCIELIRHTNGHPWWLGLIAGQITAQLDTVKGCLEKSKVGDVPEGERIKHYFKDIWAPLSPDLQDILRYLVEAPRALTRDEINRVIGGTFNRITKNVKKLDRLGMLVKHESPIFGQESYQVHPLMRQYVHEAFPPSNQQAFVTKILYMFLPRSIVDILFGGSLLDTVSDTASPRDVADSVETCLTSRNEIQAMKLMERYQETLLDNGLHHKFQFLATRILDSIDWGETRICERSSGTRLLMYTINQLYITGERARGIDYLRKMETGVSENSFGYCAYLNISAQMSWDAGDYERALQFIDKHDRAVEQLGTAPPGGLWDLELTGMLAYRDSGQYEEALNRCRSLRASNKSHNIAEVFGNEGRCLLKLGRLDEAESLLIQSLNILHNKTGYHSSINVGYAYLWLAEIRLLQGNPQSAGLLLKMAWDTWGEFAPSLLPMVGEIDGVIRRDHGIEIESISEDDARCYISQVLLDAASTVEP
ncbi:metallophosphoesterase [Alicyclobacillus fastidiosus]|uniref:Metallophosphoesterase n=1 Tax=Alicyclobacillus fastidiosus TaxID=392011 RepID=A0ABV5AI00_9BACL|nr:metallophosphoesterase [Alicyclobacillus fastidiosus]WEH10075.1 metallophosphoesterase [Alicyclobacillus fastidiosus]